MSVNDDLGQNTFFINLSCHLSSQLLDDHFAAVFRAVCGKRIRKLLKNLWYREAGFVSVEQIDLSFVIAMLGMRQKPTNRDKSSAVIDKNS